MAGMEEEGRPKGQSGLSANKVGDAIGQQLDIEFDDEIKDNLNEAEFRGSGGDASSDKHDQGEDQYSDNDQVDHEEVELDVEADPAS